MLKLSIIIGIFFSLLAFAKANDDVDKIDFGMALCRQGQPETYAICHSTLTDQYLKNTSYFRLATDICPAAGGNDGRLIIRCFNKANERFQLRISSCNSEKSYRRRVNCIKAIVTQAENERLQNEINRARTVGGRKYPSRDNSLRSPVDKVPARPSGIDREASAAGDF